MSRVYEPQKPNGFSVGLAHDIGVCYVGIDYKHPN